MKKKIMLSCFGRRNNYLTPNYLNKKNYLKIMFTDIYVNNYLRNALFYLEKIVKFKLLNKIYLRSSKNLPSSKVISYPSIRIKSLIRSLLNKFIYKKNFDIYKKFVFESQLFNENIIKKLSSFNDNFFFYSYRNDSL